MNHTDKTAGEAVQQTLANFLETLPDARRVWVAFSGGLDSSVLLHGLARVQPNHSVQVLHVNHQISPLADQWQAHCAAVAEAYGLPFTAEKVRIEAAGKGLENAARQSRYQVFERYLEAGDLLLMAHHADDQSETLLLRLLRGAGMRGLGAMPAVRALGQGRLGRPLLQLTRANLQAYAHANELQWIEDESNQSTLFDRNFLRLQVFPVLRTRWPHAATRFGEAAALLRENELLLNEYVQEDLVRAQRRPERLGESLDLGVLLGLSRPRRNALLRFWINACGYQLPEREQLAQFDRLAAAAEDARPELCWGHCALRRFNGRVYLVPQLAAPLPVDCEWQPGDTLDLGQGFRLSARPAPQGLRADRSYRLRLRTGGERCRPHNRAHSQKLKKLLQEHQLEPWLRNRVPLIYNGDELAAVGDLWVCEGFYVEGEGAVQVEWGVEL